MDDGVSVAKFFGNRELIYVVVILDPLGFIDGPRVARCAIAELAPEGILSRNRHRLPLPEQETFLVKSFFYDIFELARCAVNSGGLRVKANAIHKIYLLVIRRALWRYDIGNLAEFFCKIFSIGNSDII